MTLPASRSRTVFRACVVTAVREGESLMEQLVANAIEEIAKQESDTRVLAKRDLANEALRLLRANQAALVKGYPMALLEMFADGPEVGATKAAAPAAMDFGELSLVDDDEVQAQVELSRAQQVAMHTTEEALTELNGLVSAAQGLARVQPERNPLRPENYIRALQRTVADTQVITPVREVWMAPMRNLLGTLLVDVYKRASKGLRDHGVEQVGWGARATAAFYSPGGGGGAPASRWSDAVPAGGGQPSTWAPGGAVWHGSGGGPASAYAGSGMAPQVEEALLTVGILRDMLAGVGDPYMEVHSGVAPVHAARPSAHAPVRHATPSGYNQSGMSEVMEDMAQLERLVGRLAGSQPGYVNSGQPAVSMRSSQPGSIYGTADGAPMGAEVVARMVENISRDSRLLPPVRKAVQDLEPAIRKLIRHDSRFFTDANHPARRLLDDMTQRSLAYTSVDAPGFSRFIRLIEQAVAHLTKADITSAQPFETVDRALQAAWAAQEKKRQARQEREKYALMLAEEREMRAERIAAEIAALPELAGAPQDIADFVNGPWVESVALLPADGDGALSKEARDAIALARLLLWSVQPALALTNAERLDEAMALLPVRIRPRLQALKRSSQEIDQFLGHLARLHQAVLLAQPPDIELPHDEPAEPEVAESAAAAVDPAPEPAAAPAASPSDGFVIGAWVDLLSSGKRLRTQLTWCSPHNTLYLFTAPDGSTQSMTRRMRDKLISEGALQLAQTQSVVAHAIDALARTTRRSSPQSRR